MWLGVKEHFVILKRQVPSSHDPEDSGKGRGPGEASRVCDQARAMWPPLGLPGLIPDLFFGMGLQPPPSRTKPSRKGEINATMNGQEVILRDSTASWDPASSMQGTEVSFPVMEGNVVPAFGKQRKGGCREW